LHLERDEQCTLGVVLVAERSAEDGEECVTRVLLHEAVVAADSVAQGGDRRIDHVQQLFRDRAARRAR